jgi:hypothetical protein
MFGGSDLITTFEMTTHKISSYESKFNRHCLLRSNH